MHASMLVSHHHNCYTFVNKCFPTLTNADNCFCIALVIQLCYFVFDPNYTCRQVCEHAVPVDDLVQALHLVSSKLHHRRAPLRLLLPRQQVHRIYVYICTCIYIHTCTYMHIHTDECVLFMNGDMLCMLLCFDPNCTCRRVCEHAVPVDDLMQALHLGYNIVERPSGCYD